MQKYLNTSYVDIKHMHLLFMQQIKINLNTSYVDIKLLWVVCIILLEKHLNTSYVDIKLFINFLGLPKNRI